MPQSPTKPDLNQHIGEFSSFPLIWAMMTDERSVEMLDVLIQAGANVNFATPEGYTALHSVGDYSYRSDTTAEDDYAIAAYLVAQGGDLNARNHYDWTPLSRAIREGVAEEVEALLRAGADPNARMPTRKAFAFELGDTPLANALSDPKKVKLLLAHGADASVGTEEGQSLIEKIDTELSDQTTVSYAPYYDGLRQSRTLISATIRPN